MVDEFISEPIVPVGGTFDTAAMARAEPGLPGRFTWRDTEYAVADVLETWKESGPCKTHGSEMYLRKHWFRIKCDGGLEMTIYFQRQPRSRSQRKQRWWLYTINRTGETS